MSAATSTAEKSLYIELPAMLTIDMVEGLAGNLLSMPLTGGVVLMIDASQVETITTPGVQLIVAVAHALEAHKGNLCVIKSSVAFTQAFEALGLGPLLGTWEASACPKKS